MKFKLIHSSIQDYENCGKNAGEKMPRWNIQAGAELGQAQLKLGLDFTSTNLHLIAKKLVLLYSLSRPTFHFTPF